MGDDVDAWVGADDGDLAGFDEPVGGAQADAQRLLLSRTVMVAGSVVAVGVAVSVYLQLERTGSVKGTPPAPKSIRKAHEVLSRPLGDAVKRGDVVRNVAEHATPPPIRRRGHPGPLRHVLIER